MDSYDIFKKLTTNLAFTKKASNPTRKPEQSLLLREPQNGLLNGVNGHEESSVSIKRKQIDDIANDPDDMKVLGNVTSDDILNASSNKKKSKKQKKTVEKVIQIKTESINHTRNMFNIHVNGDDIPEPTETFEKLFTSYGIPLPLQNNLLTYNFPEPTPIQMQAIPAMLSGREVMACAPTGSGKTIAFLLPILYHLKQPEKKGFRALILAPTRELVQQTYLQCCHLSAGMGFRVHIINNTNKALSKFNTKSSKKFDILITTPKRLEFLLSNEETKISLSSVEWLVIDEADKLFEDGKQSFREQLAGIYKACDNPLIKRAMFSATLTNDVENWCKSELDNLIQISIGRKNLATYTVEQEIIYVGNEHGKLFSLRGLFKKGFEPPILVFVQSKDRAKELFKELIYDGINVDVIHAERSQQQRDNTIRAFRQGKIWVLICTELMGRGIDFKGVNLVINYDFPLSAISYIHRIGRTGRAGRLGRAVTFFTDDDRPYLRSIANVMKQAGCEVPDYMLKLKKSSKKLKRLREKKAPKRKRISTSLYRGGKFSKKDDQDVLGDNGEHDEITNGETEEPEAKTTNGHGKKANGKKMKAKKKIDKKNQKIAKIKAAKSKKIKKTGKK